MCNNKFTYLHRVSLLVLIAVTDDMCVFCFPFSDQEGPPWSPFFTSLFLCQYQKRYRWCFLLFFVSFWCEWVQTCLYQTLFIFYNDYETSYTTYINHARWHRCLCSDGLRVGGNRSAQRKPTCLTWWPHDHLTCIEPGSQRSEASALTLRQPDSLHLCLYQFVYYN